MRSKLIVLVPGAGGRAGAGGRGQGAVPGAGAQGPGAVQGPWAVPVGSCDNWGWAEFGFEYGLGYVLLIFNWFSWNIDDNNNGLKV